MSLHVDGVYMTFSGVDALADVSFEIGRGEWLGMIGPNGSGKSTMLNVISGIYRPRAGDIRFGGSRITRVGRRRRIAHGVCRTFQHPQLAASLSLEENVMLGAIRNAKVGRSERRAREEARRLLEIFGCAAYAQALPEESPYGVSKVTEVARALAADPRLLLLDEPAAGLSQEERGELIAALRLIRAERPEITLCLVEHDVGLVASLCERLAVLSAGRLIALGPTDDVLKDENVRTAYLGSGGTR